ncbi:unnamed protein product [Bursaphelenchus okinawaensis]|uniref:Mannosyltransferase n=1 Tax=Bursaphelenchus okinawaensis TaxID=465554 RepID=A0A811KYZ5_9BILA|nr:unnamed protein product [Bursaphelenchus okinawaensis]CAG9114845.1 unnamed protein product [Bursaphelenchus okinawaensis]
MNSLCSGIKAFFSFCTVHKKLVLFRLCIFLGQRTWFVPDEYFQSVEVAYSEVFGKGTKTWEWEPDKALRSYLHPLFYMVPFYVLKLLNLDTAWAFQFTVGLIHFILTLVADVAITQCYRRILSNKKSQDTALILYQMNWFILYCTPRTLANTIEMLLGVYAAALYPKVAFIPLVLLAGLIRPTSAIVWAPLVLQVLFKGGFKFIGKFILISIVLAAITISVDYSFYGKLTIPVINFFLFNIYTGGSSKFGVNSIFYYLGGLVSLAPVESVLLVLLILFNLKMVSSHLKWMWKKERMVITYCLLSLLYILIHSAIPHKEHRFLLPIIPFIVPLVASLYSKICPKTSIFKFAMVNIPFILIFGLIHQCAHQNVMREVGHKVERHENGKISYLTPCYSLPHYAWLHPNGLKWNISQLDCISNIDGDEDKSPQDLFFENPITAITNDWDKYVGDAKIIVMYDKLINEIAESGLKDRFERAYNNISFFHTFWPVGENSGQYLIVFTRK